jgi:L,D-transpeptidase catalytic domain
MRLRLALPLALLVLLAAALVPAASTSSPSLAPAARTASAQLAPSPPKPSRTVHLLAAVSDRLSLRAAPGSGIVVARVGPRTEFGGPRVLGVVARRGSWLGVTAPELADGAVAWVHRRDPGLSLRRTALSLHADLSARTLELRRGGRRVLRLSVAVGRPGSTTPTGRLAVTDKLDGERLSPYYGCCILALSGHQPNLPEGWSGGNRLAIHGTSSPGTIGTAASAGCLRAGDSPLRTLMRRVPLGTPVLIRP